MEATFNIWTIIFFLAAIHGLVFSLFFFIKKEGRGISNKLLGIFLLLFSLTLLDYVGYWTGYQLVFPHLLKISSTFIFLFGPVLYLYVISILKPGKVFRIQNLVHFLPFVVFLGSMLPFYFQPGAAKLAYIEQVRQVSEFSAGSAGIISVKTLHLLSYSVILLFYTKFLLFRNKVITIDFTSEEGGWLNIISYNFIGFSLCFILYNVSVTTINFNIEYDYMIFVAMAAFIFSVGYLGYFNDGVPGLSGVANDKYVKYDITSTDAISYRD